MSFNPHTHEGCDLRNSKAWDYFTSFNPHTHEGCDFLRLYVLKASIVVSIHTPTKGVTQIELEMYAALEVSIHTPTKGVTHQENESEQRVQVSIHTPTKGVTAYSANS